MQLGKMKYTVVILLFIALIETALAATCTYYRSSNRITCGSVTCRTRSPGWWSRGKLPAGYYYIDDYGYKGTWFKLYRQRVAGGYWDYHSRVPELTCCGGFTLHPGTYSRGCITVSDNNCYEHLKNVITQSISSDIFLSTWIQHCELPSWVLSNKHHFTFVHYRPGGSIVFFNDWPWALVCMWCLHIYRLHNDCTWLYIVYYLMPFCYIGYLYCILWTGAATIHCMSLCHNIR